MATVSDLTLTIDVVNDGPDLEARITVEYDIDFSSYDQNSNQPYREVCRLIGDDTGIAPAEDGVDDLIPNGQLFPFLLFPGQVASDGKATVHRTRTKTIPLSSLNEDSQAGANPDEIRAQVTLSPILPVAVSRESSQVLLNVT
jgi:hypothetical protein